MLSNTVFAQNKGIQKFYVNEKLYCTHTFFINPDRSETSYLTFRNIENFLDADYTSSPSSRYENEHGVTIMDFQKRDVAGNLKNVFTLSYKKIDEKDDCILVFTTTDGNTSNTQIYKAKMVVVYE